MADHGEDERRIVDTNVLATANGHHDDAPSDCVAECATKLQAIMENGHVVLDDGWRIMGQYKTNINGPGAGYEFLQWLYQNRCNQTRCTEISITAKPHDPDDFEEVPTPLELPEGEQIDPSDRVFLAVAAAHPDHAPIVQATDSKWIGWESALLAHAIEIEWVCREYAERTYAKKMPARAQGGHRGKRKARSGPTRSTPAGRRKARR
jgi:hypothetical protein